jgi:predicted alpha/beta hydrolase family esterase
MRTALICHGVVTKEVFDAGTLSCNAAVWYPWVQHQLEFMGIWAQAPLFEKSYLPVRNYASDANLLKIFDINNDSILIGHSCGGGMLVKYLSQNPNIKISQLILVAPWIDPTHEFDSYFDFEPDPKLSERIGQIDLIYSTDDHHGDLILKSCEKLIKLYPDMKVHKFDDKNHFSGDMKELPELLKIIKL